ncbi:Esterase lipase thioesterase active site [Coemansia sp. RSA 2703]|nr:Esterase lipase thioesterase active site [Coemansia sp. RSA 2703]KAJ2377915.1 Esterase lipase thioesterase active site [Coemansia sp. RSA 2607]KAJ2397934.1 Esterase lipase thioesterase active site [Coemansia sp. RSA 2603]
MEKVAAAYGSWKSAVSASAVAQASSSVGSVVVDPSDTRRVYWLESRPQEGGRYALLSKPIDEASAPATEHLADVKWNVRTAVHEYGGGAYTVRGGTLVFSNWSDGGMYVVDLSADGEEPRRVGEQGCRYASFAVHPGMDWAVCVREDHRVAGEPQNSLVAVGLRPDAGADRVLYAASDFVSSPAFDAEGAQLAFFSWDHPEMNWDATVLRHATVHASNDDLSISGLSSVAGHSVRESIYQPRFDAAGALHFLADRSGFWNPYHVDVRGGGQVQQSLAQPVAADFAGPEWVFGESTLLPVAAGRVAVTYSEQGSRRVGVLDVESHTIEQLVLPADPVWTSVGSMQLATASDDASVLLVVAGGPKARPALYACWLDGSRVNLVAGHPECPAADSVSVPRQISFRTRLPPFDAASEEVDAYAWYYAPTNAQYTGLPEELPPLLVMIHGGPTSAAQPVYQARVQFWSSRGFAVADVDYGGSTGRGRAYRERLYGAFGLVDVQDCCAAALALADMGLADRQRLSIMGGSAGGFTTLACLAFRPDVFAVGASLYGISDLAVLAKETHKFEAQYPVHLIGASVDDAPDLYHARSPIHAVQNIQCPAIFLQGLEDRVVPPNQASMMADALSKRGVRVALVEFAGEQHGFRQAANIIRALEAQLYFFGRVLGFVPADTIDPVAIKNE